MSARVMRLVCLADGRDHEAEGQFLAAYDPDGNGGMGYIEFTPDKAKALAFESAGAALEFWRKPSTVIPRRDDGKPNRPLTAFTCEIIPLEQS